MKLNIYIKTKSPMKSEPAYKLLCYLFQNKEYTWHWGSIFTSINSFASQNKSPHPLLPQSHHLGNRPAPKFIYAYKGIQRQKNERKESP